MTKFNAMSRFSRALIVWYKQYKRDLPWRKTKDPYTIWVSEIILQQTRVNQGTDYFIRFIERFPSVIDLADATEDEVLKQWEGLGYYSRARNMHFTSKFIKTELNGVFPDNYNDIIKLKGIGPYTAAAISSICFNEYRTVVDGNVFRVLTRIFGVHTPINTQKGKTEIEGIAHELNDDKDKGTFNQALMEFGAIQCTPKLPKCDTCIFNVECIALSKGLIEKLPVKEKKLVVKDRYLNFLFIQNSNKQTLIQRRDGNDIWKGLYQFPNYESTNHKTESEVLDKFRFCGNVEVYSVNELTHKLTHQRLHIQIIKIGVDEKDFSAFNEFKVINIYDINEFAFPKPLEKYINNL